MTVPLSRLAPLYGTTPQQLRRWRAAGAEIESPAKLLEHLSSVTRGPIATVATRLVNPADREAIALQIETLKHHNS